MSIGIALHRSVGRSGVNDPADVSVVQLLLNGWLGPKNAKLLKIDGVCGPLTQGAINGFQAASSCARDSRIDPHGPTLRALGELSIQQLIDGVRNAPPLPPISKPPAVAVAASFWQQIASARRLLT